MSEELLTLPGAARELSMTADEALGLVEAGALAAVRGADGGVYIRRRDVQAFVAARSSA